MTTQAVLEDLNDLYYFSMVAEHGGFSAAGRVLGIPKSRLSARGAALEQGVYPLPQGFCARR